jgi:hypothetical protein
LSIWCASGSFCYCQVPCSYVVTRENAGGDARVIMHNMITEREHSDPAARDDQSCDF